MREYETVIIIQPEISDEGVVEIQGRIDGTLEKAGALRLLYDDLGKRRMAYEIQNFQKGRYVILQFLDEGPVVADLERSLRLDDSVIRYLTVQIEEEVADVAARQEQAAEEERVRAEKAAERAAREAEEAAQEAARQEAEAARQAEEAAAAAAAAAAAEAAGEGEADGESEGEGERADEAEPAAAETPDEASDEAAASGDDGEDSA
jgi:small subunit ribosomal protein S6